MSQKQKNYILLTVDVEDWFQVENFKTWMPYSTWDSRELRVEKNTHRILDLFDSINGLQVNATFFVLGWIAERLPDLIREIHNRGHEVASHGYLHNLCSQETRDQLKRDLTESKKLLEDILGANVHGYRAPNFSISDDTLKLIEDCGYLYDSSFNSFSMNKRYGSIDLSRNDKKGIIYQLSKSFFEIPVSNLTFRYLKIDLPWGGGGYFRLYPLPLFKKGVQSILQNEEAYVFYMHPWEVDPKQPKVDEASLFFKFRHYLNLDKTEIRLKKMISDFRNQEFITCREMVNNKASL
jgi:polysaccharide deacetylase family protein (PEP-CTERM system associated)